VWLGEDSRGWDHVRVHVQLLHDDRLAGDVSKAFVLGVYVGLAAHAELQTGAARPSAETLAGYIGATERTVRKCLRVLEVAGYIEVCPRPGLASVYKLLPPPPIPTPERGTGVGGEGAEPGSGHPGSSFLTTPEPGSDEREPFNENQDYAEGLGDARHGSPRPSSEDGEPGTRDPAVIEPRDNVWTAASQEAVLAARQALRGVAG
jgi:DNA-binding transcriptional MocR family regulator